MHFTTLYKSLDHIFVVVVLYSLGGEVDGLDQMLASSSLNTLVEVREPDRS